MNIPGQARAKWKFPNISYRVGVGGWAASGVGWLRRNRPFIASALGELKSRQALRTVVRDLDAGHFLERTVWLRGVANQLRSVPVDLV